MRTSLNFTFSATVERVERILRWLKTTLGHDISFIPLGSWQLNVLLGKSVINDNIFFKSFNIFRILQSGLFPSIIFEGKKVLFWKSRAILSFLEFLLHCLVLHDILCVRLIESSYNFILKLIRSRVIQKMEPFFHHLQEENPQKINFLIRWVWLVCNFF